jgi:hypothetical protein
MALNAHATSHTSPSALSTSVTMSQTCRLSNLLGRLTSYNCPKWRYLCLTESEPRHTRTNSANPCITNASSRAEQMSLLEVRRCGHRITTVPRTLSSNVDRYMILREEQWIGIRVARSYTAYTSQIRLIVHIGMKANFLSLRVSQQ